MTHARAGSPELSALSAPTHGPLIDAMTTCASTTLPLSSLSATRAFWLLSCAIQEPNDKELEAMLADGIDPNARPNPNRGLSPLYLACSKGSLRAVEALLAAGARPNDLSLAPSPFSPLSPQPPASGALASLSRGSVSTAALRLCVDKMQALLAAGADPLAPVKDGRTAWEELLRWKGAPPAALMPWVRAGANANAWDGSGNTMLARCVTHHEIESAMTLARLGADPFFPCRSGLTAAALLAEQDSPSWDPLRALFDAVAERRELTQALPALAPKSPRSAL